MMMADLGFAGGLGGIRHVEKGVGELEISGSVLENRL